jgi:hypothetical protein
MPQTYFDKLPGLLSGIGIAGNYTYIDGKYESGGEREWLPRQQPHQHRSVRATPCRCATRIKKGSASRDLLRNITYDFGDFHHCGGALKNPQ